MKSRIARAVATAAVGVGVLLGSAAVAAPAQAGINDWGIEGAWSTKSACMDAQWRSIQAHPSWYHSGCYYAKVNGGGGRYGEDGWYYLWDRTGSHP